MCCYSVAGARTGAALGAVPECLHYGAEPRGLWLRAGAVAAGLTFATAVGEGVAASDTSNACSESSDSSPARQFSDSKDAREHH
jgi:hypothetical protein